MGAYRLVEKIGEGGMGEVYLAERVEGEFVQRVAVKVTRSSLRDGESLRRFRAERQILASLQHPHIVTLLDGGTTAAGETYLVMEFVDGVPLTRYCSEGARTLEQRLDLLRKVCAAVQYAHQRGIVHRDLKPANILVTADGVPKVLDFGVAKLLESSALAAGTVTGLVQGPLTPNYASPEQLRGLAGHDRVRRLRARRARVRGAGGDATVRDVGQDARSGARYRAADGADASERRDDGDRGR